VLVFLVNKLQVAFILLLTFIVIRQVIKIPLNSIKYFKNLSLLAVFIVLLQTLFFPGENYMIPPLGGIIYLKWEGFYVGILVVCRLFALVLLLPILSETASPYRLAAALSALGLNYRVLFVITTALNLIPLFRDEALAIMDAQKLRGMKRSLKAYTFLVFPLVLGAMRKAQVASAAMDSRAFGVYKTRTWLEKPRMNKYDYTIILFCVIFTAVFLFINYWLF
jgi:energy-coupling factor transport system permease protein